MLLLLYESIDWLFCIARGQIYCIFCESYYNILYSYPKYLGFIFMESESKGKSHSVISLNTSNFDLLGRLRSLRLTNKSYPRSHCFNNIIIV